MRPALKLTFTTIAIVVLTSVPAFADPKERKENSGLSGWGLGVFLGEPTGVTAQLDLAETQAVEFKAAWNFTSTEEGSEASGSLTFQANYVLWFPGTLTFDSVDIPPYVGAGAEVRISSDLPVIGIRIPFGLRYRFSEAPLELALELGVGLTLFPSTRFMGSGGLAIRWLL